MQEAIPIVVQVNVVFPLAGIVFLVGLLLARFFIRRHFKKSVLPSTFIWEVLVIAVLIFLAVWTSNELIEDDAWQYRSCIGIITLAGALINLRELSFELLDTAFKPQTTGAHAYTEQGQNAQANAMVHVLRDLFILFIATELTRISLDLAWNEYVWDISWLHALYSLILIGLPMLTFYFFTQRRGLGPALVVAACTFIGVAQYFVIRFKGAGIVPADLYAINTAAEVSGGFTFYLAHEPLVSITIAVCAWAVLAFIQPPKFTAATKPLRLLAKNSAGAFVSALALYACITVPNYKYDLGISITYWSTYAWYQTQGFLPTFFRALQDIEIPKPTDYNNNDAQALLEQLSHSYEQTMSSADKAKQQAAQAQFSELSPSVVIVMNEAFSDLSVLDGESWGYTGPEFFARGLTDASLRGRMYMSVIGGGTCNTEFEVLTGTSMAFLGAGKYPYQMYDFTNAPSLARQFKELGYRATAIHPSNPENWNRERAYQSLGFDEFISVADFPTDAPRFHNGISDKATYEQIIELLTTNNTPQFIYDVTMQNHSGYDTRNVPQELLGNYTPSGADPETDADLNEYLACIEASDKDLEWFVSQLRELDRPVVLVFFGDHQPKLADWYNDLLFPNEDPESVEHLERTHFSDYLVWANYELAGNSNTTQYQDLGSDVLAPWMLSHLGAPLTNYQEAQLEIHKSIAVINSTGYQTSGKNWYATDDETNPAAEKYHDMATINYLVFGSLY